MTDSTAPTDPLQQAELNALLALFNAGRHAEMEQRARQLAAHHPESGFAWKVLGIALQVQGKDALPALQKAAVLLPGDVEVHINLGIALAAGAQPGDAVQCYRRALEIDPANAPAYYNLGNALGMLGRADDAIACYRRALAIRPDYAAAHNNLGLALTDSGQYDEAAASLRRALALYPDFAAAHNNLGNALKKSGQAEAALASYRSALAIAPDFAEAHNNLGTVLADLGQPEQAMTHYRHALRQHADYAEAHSNLGNALKATGQHARAAASYRHALAIAPRFPEAHNNLGTLLADLGQYDEAAASYRSALAVDAGYADALNNLAALLNAQGQPIPALELIWRSLAIGETQEAKHIFVACIKHLHLTHDDNALRATLARALTEPWGRPIELAWVGARIAKLNPALAACVTRVTHAWPARLPAQQLFGADGPDALAADALLHALLVSAPLCDVELERFFANVRGNLLDAGATLTAQPIAAQLPAPLSSFYAALARQCFINEYAFPASDEEWEAAGRLCGWLCGALERNMRVPAAVVLAVASYFPLHTLPEAAHLLDMDWPAETAAVLMQQISEPMQERRLRATIPRATEIGDAVSLLVQDQYEENPYPRWIGAAPVAAPKTVDQYLSQKFPLSPFKRRGQAAPPDILVAGCGTGQHPIGTARLFRDAHVLAIDLSMSSLAYAKRKTLELGLTSVEYAQADILKLASIGRSFDVVESSGVLHHMADPWEGWRVLLSLLRPGGVMRLGFYSAVARRNIAKTRDFIAARGYGSQVDDIRRCRQDVIDLKAREECAGVLHSSDFFSISACRDLLFHVQEHRMTLTAIDAFLQENSMAFLGFETAAENLRTYKQRFPGDHAAVELAQWQVFENEHPDTFLDMYQFWVQKKE